MPRVSAAISVLTAPDGEAHFVSDDEEVVPNVALLNPKPRPQPGIGGTLVGRTKVVLFEDPKADRVTAQEVSLPHVIDAAGHHVGEPFPIERAVGVLFPGRRFLLGTALGEAFYLLQIPFETEEAEIPASLLAARPLLVMLQEVLEQRFQISSEAGFCGRTRILRSLRKLLCIVVQSEKPQPNDFNHGWARMSQNNIRDARLVGLYTNKHESEGTRTLR